MAIGILIVDIVAITLLYFSYKIYNGNISYIHSYHTKNIKSENLKLYSKQFSLGLLVMGIGLIFSSLFMYLEKGMFVLIAMMITFIVGILIIGNAQNKYNGGWFA